MSYKTDNCKSCHDQRNWVIVMKASQAHSSPIRNEQNYEKRMTKGKELEVPEDSESVKSFLDNCIICSVFNREVDTMFNTLPKRHYTIAY